MSTTIGISSYGDLKGVAQVLDDEAGRQFVGLANEVNAALGYTTAATPRITPNEGFRGKPRQKALLTAHELYEAGLGPYAALAASPLYSSNHGPNGDVKRSRATDIGVTMPDGTNRALTAYEQAAWRSHENAWGFWSAGDKFSSEEVWHKEYRPDLYPPSRIAPVGITIATPVKSVAAQRGSTMLAKAVNDTRDKSLGAIKGRLFAVSDATVQLDGKTYNGTVRWIQDKTEAATLGRFGTTNVDSTEIWDLVKNRGYKRVSW